MGSTLPLGVRRLSMESPTFFDVLFNKFLLSNNRDEEVWLVVDI